MAGSVKDSVLILPYPISKDKLSQATIEIVQLGNSILRVDLPPVTLGQRVRLKGAGRYIDPSMEGSDVFLMITETKNHVKAQRRDVQLELPLNFNSLYTDSKRRRIKINGRVFEVTIPQSARPGQLLRMRDLAELCNGGHAGDIFLRLSPTTHRFWTLWGLLDDFAEISSSKIHFKFSVPLLFEVGGEFEFRAPEFSASGKK